MKRSWKRALNGLATALCIAVVPLLLGGCNNNTAKSPTSPGTGDKKASPVTPPAEASPTTPAPATIKATTSGRTISIELSGGSGRYFVSLEATTAKGQGVSFDLDGQNPLLPVTAGKYTITVPVMKDGQKIDELIPSKSGNIHWADTNTNEGHLIYHDVPVRWG